MAPTQHIPLIYRLFHLYIEPFLFVPSGIYLCLFDPLRFLISTTPGPIAAPFSIGPPSAAAPHSPAEITPLLRILLTNTAGLYLMFVLNEVLVLRLTSDIKVWRAVIFSMLCCDVIHVYAVAAAAGPGFMLDIGAWRFEDWANTCVLSGGAVLRLFFLMGVGFGKREEKKE
jgi:hypothetical protein